MLIFTDGSAQGNPGPTGEVYLAISLRGTRFEGELEAIYMGTEYARNNLSSSNNNLHIYTNSQVAIKAIIRQSRENCHKNTIIKISENLISICQMVDEIKLIYGPAHKGIPDNETADSLVNVASKKAKHLPERPEISRAKISKAQINFSHYKNGKGDEKIQNTTNKNKLCNK